MMSLTTGEISFGTTLPWCDPLLTALLASHSSAASTSSSSPVDRLLMSYAVLTDAKSDMETDESSAPDEDGKSTDEAFKLFDCLGPIGSGGFGTVMLAQSRLRPTRFFAAKTITELLHFSEAFHSACTSGSSATRGHERVLALPDILHSALESQQNPSLAAFLREAQLAVSLPPHPHIAHYGGVVLSPSPRGPSAYLLMELGAGGTFGAFCQRHDAGITEDHLVCWLSQLLRGMDRLHAAGVLHRDVKPSNILVRRPAASPSPAWSSAVELFLADFGISARADDPHRRAEHTVVGTGGYCPPEIARHWGHSARCPYSCAADVWSLATVFYVFLACGAEQLDDGMSAVMAHGEGNPRGQGVEAFATATLVRVARGEYPSLSLLNAAPLLPLSYSLPPQSAQPCATEYSATCDGGDLWAVAPGAQRMAQRVQARGLSSEWLRTIDEMMKLCPAERPTARALLSRSPLFALRLPWWEATAKAIAVAVRDGREDPLLDVCNGDSDEEEEERAEEEAAVRRIMSPLVPPIENGAFIPHAVVNSWIMDCMPDTSDIDITSAPTEVKPHITEAETPEGSLVAQLIAALTALTAVPCNNNNNNNNNNHENKKDSEDEHNSNANIGDNTCGELGRRVGLYAVHSVRCTERIFTSMRDEMPTDDGPLRHALQSHGLESECFIHVRLQLRAQPLVAAFILPDPTRTADEAPDVADEDDMTRLAMEALVEAAQRWLMQRGEEGPHRHCNAPNAPNATNGTSATNATNAPNGTNAPNATNTTNAPNAPNGTSATNATNAPNGPNAPCASLAALPWVSWHHDGHCFTVEYIAAARRGRRHCGARPDGHSAEPAGRVTADVCGVLREWRARLCDLRSALDRAAACVEASALCRGRHRQMRRGLRRAAAVIDAAEAKLRGTEAREVRVAQWLCVCDVPAAEECLRALGGEANALVQLAEDWVAEAFVLSEGAVVTMPLDAVHSAALI